MERIVVSVSQNAVVHAESAILGCSKCAVGATTPFWQIVDNLRNHPKSEVVYILPILGTCPGCRSPIDETTLVALKASSVTDTIPAFMHNRL
jgi:hypothetical protein